MGNNCTQCPSNLHTQKQQSLLNHLTYSHQYFDAQPPTDPFLQKYLAQSTNITNLSIDLPQSSSNLTASTSSLTATKGNKRWKKSSISNRYFYGEWKKGVPHGQGIMYEPGKVVVNGGFQMGVVNGQGHIIYIHSNSEYKGMIKDGKYNGIGKMADYNQMFSFEGQWRNSQPVKGVLQLLKDSNIQQIQVMNYQKRFAKIFYRDGRIYQGEINTKLLMPQGRGRVNFSNLDTKDSYEGEWTKGKYNGHGIFAWKNKQYYKGQYRDGVKCGKGKFVFANGNWYDGGWVNGRQNGFGVLYDRNGLKIREGEWRDGVLVGGDDQFRMSRLLTKNSCGTFVNLDRQDSFNQKTDNKLTFIDKKPPVRHTKSLSIQNLPKTLQTPQHTTNQFQSQYSYQQQFINQMYRPNLDQSTHRRSIVTNADTNNTYINNLNTSLHNQQIKMFKRNSFSKKLGLI